MSSRLVYISLAGISNTARSVVDSSKGMLASAETVHIVAEALKHHKVTSSVVDPVIGSTSTTLHSDQD